MRRLLLMATALFAVVATAQSPSTNTRIYSYYMLPGGTAWIWKAIVIDPPLTITLDSTGQAHLKIPATVGETFRTVNTTYTLSNTPRNSPNVFLNGLLQSEGDDYKFSGKTITFVRPIADPPIIQIFYYF